MDFVNNQKQPTCLSIAVSYNALWDAQGIEYSAAVTKSEIDICTVTQEMVRFKKKRAIA